MLQSLINGISPNALHSAANTNIINSPGRPEYDAIQYTNPYYQYISPYEKGYKRIEFPSSNPLQNSSHGVQTQQKKTDLLQGNNIRETPLELEEDISFLQQKKNQQLSYNQLIRKRVSNIIKTDVQSFKKIIKEIDSNQETSQRIIYFQYCAI